LVPAGDSFETETERQSILSDLTDHFGSASEYSMSLYMRQVGRTRLESER
jgi:hypothetical protein